MNIIYSLTIALWLLLYEIIELTFIILFLEIAVGNILDRL